MYPLRGRTLRKDSERGWELVAPSEHALTKGKENTLIGLLLFIFLLRPSGKHCLARDLRPPFGGKPRRSNLAAFRATQLP